MSISVFVDFVAIAIFRIEHFLLWKRLGEPPAEWKARRGLSFAVEKNHG